MALAHTINFNKQCSLKVIYYCIDVLYIYRITSAESRSARKCIVKQNKRKENHTVVKIPINVCRYIVQPKFDMKRTI